MIKKKSIGCIIRDMTTPEPDRDPDKPDFRSNLNFFWNRPLEIISGALMLAGIIISFFYLHIGGILVGLAFGLCFFNELQTFFYRFLDIYSEQGVFKTLMLLATILYFLISIPAFIVCVAIGFAAILIIRLSFKK